MVFALEKHWNNWCSLDPILDHERCRNAVKGRIYLYRIKYV
jgi:hypothetical protein